MKFQIKFFIYCKKNIFSWVIILPQEMKFIKIKFLKITKKKIFKFFLKHSIGENLKIISNTMMINANRYLTEKFFIKLTLKIFFILNFGKS